MHLTEIQLDALRELANIGAGNAATSLSAMLGCPVDISVPDARLMPLADGVDAAGQADSLATAVLLPVFGDMEAHVLLLFGEGASTIPDLLGVGDDPEMAMSALAEVGNIVGSAYLTAVSSMTGLHLEPSPPQAAVDMLGAIVATVLSSVADESDTTLYIDSALEIEGTEASFSFMLVPARDGVHELLARLGLA